MALWTIDHVLNTESRFAKLQADAYAQAMKNVYFDKIGRAHV